jgi:hypothetical protein
MIEVEIFKDDLVGLVTREDLDQRGTTDRFSPA